MPGAPRGHIVRFRDSEYRYLVRKLLTGAPSPVVRGHTGIQWASCNKPQSVNFMVTNPGTSFAQIQLAKPVFAGGASFPTFNKPCDE